MHAARVRFRSRSFRSCSSADSTTGSDPIPLLVHALLLVSARRFLNVVYCFCDAAAAAAARFGFKSAAAACLCDAEDAAAAATRSQLRRRGGRACRIGPIGDAAGDWASNWRNRCPLRRRCRPLQRRLRRRGGRTCGIEVAILDQHVQPGNCGRCCQQVDGVEQLEI